MDVFNPEERRIEKKSKYEIMKEIEKKAKNAGAINKDLWKRKRNSKANY